MNCGHCGGNQLYRDREGDIMCLQCGWMVQPLPLTDRVLPEDELGLPYELWERKTG